MKYLVVQNSIVLTNLLLINDHTCTVNPFIILSSKNPKQMSHNLAKANESQIIILFIQVQQMDPRLRGKE